MERITALVLLCLSIALPGLFAQEFSVDGVPGEWRGIEPVVQDGRDLPESSDMLGFDIASISSHVANDQRYVYVELYGEWPLTSGAGAITWKFIVDMDGDSTEEFRIYQQSDSFWCHVRDGDDLFANRTSVTTARYARIGAHAEFSFPAVIPEIETFYPEFRFTGEEFRWIVTTNAQQKELDGIDYFKP